VLGPDGWLAARSFRTADGKSNVMNTPSSLPTASTRFHRRLQSLPGKGQFSFGAPQWNSQPRSDFRAAEVLEGISQYVKQALD
jgi:hypothetical protein